MSREEAPVLFDVAELVEGASRAGPAEAGLRAALAAAQAPAEDGRLTELDAGLVGSAIVGARALDAAERAVRRDPKAGYLVAALLTPYRETLAALGMGREEPADQPPPGAGAGTADWSSVFGAAE